MQLLCLVFFLLLRIGSVVSLEAVESAESQEEPERVNPERVNSARVRQYRIGAGFGYSSAGYRDEVESPINRYDQALTFFLDGNIEKGGFFHTLNISFFQGSPQMPDPYQGFARKRYISIRGCIEYALDCRLWGTAAFPGYLGGAFRTLICYTGTDGRDEDVPLPTGFGLLSLDLHATQKWIINEKNSLTFSLGYPVFGYAVRPAYAGMDELWTKYIYENIFKILGLGSVTSFHNYWAVMGDLKYRYKFHELVSSYAGLGFELSRINFARARVDALFRLNAGIAFAF